VTVKQLHGEDAQRLPSPRQGLGGIPEAIAGYFSLSATFRRIICCTVSTQSSI
jgi:hypothetical protein